MQREQVDAIGSNVEDRTYKDQGSDRSCRRGRSTGCLSGAAERGGGAVVVDAGDTETGGRGLLSQEGDAVRLEGRGQLDVFKRIQSILASGARSVGGTKGGLKHA